MMRLLLLMLGLSLLTMTIAKPVVIEEEDGVREQTTGIIPCQFPNVDYRKKSQLDSSEESVEDGDESQSRKKRQLYLEGDDNDEAVYDNGNDWDNGEQFADCSSCRLRYECQYCHSFR